MLCPTSYTRTVSSYPITWKLWLAKMSRTHSVNTSDPESNPFSWSNCGLQLHDSSSTILRCPLISPDSFEFRTTLISSSTTNLDIYVCLISMLRYMTRAIERILLTCAKTKIISGVGKSNRVVVFPRSVLDFRVSLPKHDV